MTPKSKLKAFGDVYDLVLNTIKTFDNDVGKIKSSRARPILIYLFTKSGLTKIISSLK